MHLKILGFDIGVTSIGWAFVEGEELKDCGVRIFTKAENPKNGDSLAAPRREARSTRRRLARRKARLNAIKRLLCEEFGLNLNDYLANDGELPKAYETTKDTKSPYELRTLALEQKLESKELARAILHIAKHRGYGNKHAKTESDKDSKKVLSAIKTNAAAMKDKYQSVGEYLYKEFYQKERYEKKGNTPTKEFKNVRNKGENYEHCVAQEQVRAELELIFQKQ
ncbi:type II CRISPR RNA-guided endonuclease Cas9, partial [Helicobacter sp.]|uniref:type II CRISPR RNA-guided endonuclease Cas9 n=1 Tax=Helicobacter sp. TaxID=218 RepID=UPI0025C3EE8C